MYLILIFFLLKSNKRSEKSDSFVLLSVRSFISSFGLREADFFFFFLRRYLVCHSIVGKLTRFYCLISF